MTLVTGTVVAQGVVFVMTMILTRVYSAQDYGQFTQYASVVAIIASVAALRYDMTIMLPRQRSWALACARLGMVCVTVTCLLAMVVSFPLRPWVSAHWGPGVAAWLPMVGATAFLLASLQLLQYWYNRESDYKTISVNRVEQQIGQTVGQLVLGAVGMVSVGGLILGQTVGQLWAFFNLGHKARPLRAPLPAGSPSLWHVARRYKRMPLLNGPNVLVDALRLNGVNLLIGAWSVEALGQFNLAWRVLEVPLALVNGAVSQVFFHKLSTLEPGQMRPLVRLVIKRILVLALAPFAALYLVSPWLFPLLFGAQWSDSGYFARALTPWLFLTLVTSPLSNLFVVAERQDWMLGFAVVYAAAPLAWLYWSPLELLPTTYVLGAIQAILLMGMIFMADRAAAHFDTPTCSVSDGHLQEEA
ncbi:lipopolysaccharide biosynthesis protein [Actinomyces israelii]|jgi:putative transporter|uniref:lipopolysaccharide biosynthesis protein n=1 Tax=Actinomyces israelii TaxID=1659 RepID=UPI000A01EC2E|nr:oligosaccharide flippase family protein [Actinomyces israelii]